LVLQIREQVDLMTQRRQRGSRLRIALIGAGQIAREAHLPAWVANEGAELTWAVDNREEAAKGIAEEWGIPNWATDYRNLLSRDDVDAVDICLPVVAHAELTIAFLRRGCHVLVEKPVALTLDEVRAMQRAAQEAGRTLMVAENWPFSAAMRRVREILNEGEPWRPIMLQASHESAIRLPPKESPTRKVGDEHRLGYLFTAGIHTLNLARELVGEFGLITAYATPAKPGPYHPLEDDLAVAARFENGAVGSFSFTGRSRHLGPRKLAFKLIADRGVIEFDVWSGWVRCTMDGQRTTYEGDYPSKGFNNPALGFAEEVEHFIDCIATGKEPRTSADDQMRTLAAVLAAYRSLETGESVDPASLLLEGQR
jgi:predicted dehydrogenase